MADGGAGLDQHVSYGRVRDATTRVGIGVAMMGCRVLIRLVSTCVLARLLVPADFRVVALARGILNRVIPKVVNRFREARVDFLKLCLRAVAKLAFRGECSDRSCDRRMACPREIGTGVPNGPVVFWIVHWLAAAGLVAVEECILWLLIALAEGRGPLIVRSMRVGSMVVGVTVGRRWGIVGVSAGYSMASIDCFAVELVYLGIGRRHLMVRALASMWRSGIPAFVSTLLVLLLGIGSCVRALTLRIGLYRLSYIVIHVALPEGLKFLRALRNALSSMLDRRVTVDG